MRQETQWTTIFWEGWTALALHIFYGYAWAVLIARIPNALVRTAVNTVLLRILLENRALMAVAKR